MMNRKCLDDSCSSSVEAVFCTRKQMYYHILKKPTSKMIQIVTKYKLTRFPFALGRYTLANLICDYTIESVADKIINGDQQ